MATIEEMNESMTIFFYKSNGDIYSVATGIQPIEIYLGAHAADLMQIIDSVVLTLDNAVLNNIGQFKINLETKTLELIAESTLANYPVAAS